jgi:hypothetical protein
LITGACREQVTRVVRVCGFTTSDYLERNLCNKRCEKYLFTYFMLKVFQKDFVRGLCKLFVEV